MKYSNVQYTIYSFLICTLPHKYTKVLLKTMNIIDSKTIALI